MTARERTVWRRPTRRTFVKGRQYGTFWYHSHSAFQEQQGLYGPLVIESREPSPVQYDREHVIMLSDWTDESPESIFARLKKHPGFCSFNQRTVGDFVRDVETRGFEATVAERAMWGRMRMRPTDLADVTGHVYTYLTNGQSPDANWTGLFKPGERIRLRFINGSAMTYFNVRIPGLKSSRPTATTCTPSRSTSSASPRRRRSTCSSSRRDRTRSRISRSPAIGLGTRAARLRCARG